MQRKTFNLAEIFGDTAITPERSPDDLATALEVAHLLDSVLQIVDLIGADVAGAHLNQAIIALRERYLMQN